MKTPQFKFLAVLIAIAAIFSITTPGCATKPVQKVIQTEGVLITTVNTGMEIWADYVNRHLTDGKVTQKQLDTIKDAYAAYYVAQMVAKATIEKILANVSTNTMDVTTANQAVTVAEINLIQLLNLYIK